MPDDAPKQNNLLMYIIVALLGGGGMVGGSLLNPPPDTEHKHLDYEVRLSVIETEIHRFQVIELRKYGVDKW